jgi:thioredoxin reductase (NADPH)
VKSEVVGLTKHESGGITVETSRKAFQGKAVLIATGASRKTPKISGLAELEGRGVSYCAICDGFFYRGKSVAVLGSGEYALHEVNDLLPLAARITVLTNGKEPTVTFPDTVSVRTENLHEATHTAARQPFSKSSTVQNKVLSGVKFESGETLPLDGLFIAEGTAGAAELAKKMGIPTSAQGEIIIDAESRTAVSEIWAAGDCTGGLKQIVKASCEGAKAAQSIIKFLRG